MSSSKPQPSSQATQNQLLMTPPRQPQKHQHATTMTENLPKKQKNQQFSDADKDIQPLYGPRRSKQEQILGISREDMAKLILALIEKFQEQEVHMTQLEKEQNDMVRKKPTKSNLDNILANFQEECKNLKE